MHRRNRRNRSPDPSISSNDTVTQPRRIRDELPASKLEDFRTGMSEIEEGLEDYLFDDVHQFGKAETELKALFKDAVSGKVEPGRAYSKALHIFRLLGHKLLKNREELRNDFAGNVADLEANLFDCP